MAQHLVYRFYAELSDFEPKIWRRFEINGNKTMAELGYSLMVLFEMEASHLFGFREQIDYLFLDDPQKVDLIPNVKKFVRYELPIDETYVREDEIFYEADQIRLSRINREAPWNLTFEDDYGDRWEVNVSFESCEKQEIHASELPRVLEGSGYGIVEDVGGVMGLHELVTAYSKRRGQAYEMYKEWLGHESFDIHFFDKDDLNFRLKKLPRIYKECYEYGYEPTQRSIDLISRKYQIGTDTKAN
ncbi:plasmid pRiA4b ORF-3 family protein [Thermoactinomyces sp. DSM 45892]|uniref:plasmid pRiA4b ORF-3 family protein n=1 Tax=Thermoactinomyces sp. DSM 45892 TaxID=1882753 RepID=UPI00089B852A|nr:plasmid pRiA4b ORF-3 family protein [Thermoactinomyces sp. DSM 45892]SDX92928.1 pRiA4b ORF-3-like protein [Thermoactinomyces sp. DSM 45892]